MLRLFLHCWVNQAWCNDIVNIFWLARPAVIRPAHVSFSAWKLPLSVVLLSSGSFYRACLLCAVFVSSLFYCLLTVQKLSFLSLFCFFIVLVFFLIIVFCFHKCDWVANIVLFSFVCFLFSFQVFIELNHIKKCNTVKGVFVLEEFGNYPHSDSRPVHDTAVNQPTQCNHRSDRASSHDYLCICACDVQLFFSPPWCVYRQK